MRGELLHLFCKILQNSQAGQEMLKADDRFISNLYQLLSHLNEKLDVYFFHTSIQNSHQPIHPNSIGHRSYEVVAFICCTS